MCEAESETLLFIGKSPVSLPLNPTLEDWRQRGGSALAGGAVAGAMNGSAFASMTGGSVGKGALYGAIGGLAGSTAGLANIKGIGPGALYGAGTGGIISGGISALSGGSFNDGFVSGSISGGIMGGISGGVAAANSTYERNIFFGNATKAGKQAFVNDLVREFDLGASIESAGILKSVTLTDEFNGTTTNAETRPIIGGGEQTLEYAMTNNPEGTMSNMYLKYRGRNLRALGSTFRHEMVHANDYFNGGVEKFYRSQAQQAIWRTKVWAEVRAYRANIQFGYKKAMYTGELNRWLNGWQTRYGSPFPY